MKTNIQLILSILGVFLGNS